MDNLQNLKQTDPELVDMAWNWALSNVLPSQSLISGPVYTGFVDPQNLDGGGGDGRTGWVDEQD